MMFASLRLSMVAMLTLGLLTPVIAAPTLPRIFTDSAVLQRDKPVPVWGRAEPGENVTVEFKGQRQAVVTDAQGRWSVTLDPMPASAEPAVLRVMGTDATVEVKDVVVGEVWFCSGQSNMAWTVQNSLNPIEELAGADHPMVRHFRVYGTPADQPQEDNSRGDWMAAAAGTPHGGERPTMTRAFSAVAYFFARDLHQQLGVPVGVINSSVGGTMIEAWMSDSALRQSPWWPNVQQRWQQRLDDLPAQEAQHKQRLAQWEKAVAEAKAQGAEAPRRPRPPEGPNTRVMPSGLFNSMVHPIMPYAVRGILWYQGEANAVRHEEYADLFKGMIGQWRRDFRQGELPFYFVQLANWEGPRDETGQQWAFQREAQSQALTLPATGMAVTVDIGEARNVHAKNKQEVGRRLALIAMANVYGKSLEFRGPTFRQARVDGSRMTLTFDDAAGLTLREAQGDSFELAGDDRQFHPAQAVVEGQTVVVTSGQVPRPVAVRYAWRNNPASTLYNDAGLPAPPFRSDDWPATQSP